MMFDDDDGGLVRFRFPFFSRSPAPYSSILGLAAWTGCSCECAWASFIRWRSVVCRRFVPFQMRAKDFIKRNGCTDEHIHIQFDCCRAVFILFRFLLDSGDGCCCFIVP